MVSAAAPAHDLREGGRAVTVARSRLTITPPRDWNRLDARPGPRTEVWTLDGAPLNAVTFFADVAPGDTLIRERHRKRAPLPKFRSTLLLVELPDLLAASWRARKGLADVAVTESRPDRFLGAPAVRFRYSFVDADALPRRGEGIAAIVARRLYMITYEAPRLHYFDRSIADFRALAASATLSGQGTMVVNR